MKDIIHVGIDVGSTTVKVVVMNKKLEVLYNRKPCYDIVIEKEFQTLTKEISKLDTANRKLCII